MSEQTLERINSVTVGQVWEDRHGRQRIIVAILDGGGDPVFSVENIEAHPIHGKAYDVVWQSTPRARPRTTFCTTWERWVNHATLIQEDS